METYLLANTIISRGIDERIRMRPMKLQKLMYFTCGVYAVYHNQWLIRDDFYAYPYGPVERRTYNYFSNYGSNPIRSYMYNNSIANLDKSPALREVLDVVFVEYGHESDIDLSDITHQSKSPWWNTCHEKGLRYKIDRIDIRDYFKKEIEQGNIWQPD